MDSAVLHHTVETTDGTRVWYIAEKLGIVMEMDIQNVVLKSKWVIPDAGFQVYRGLFYMNDKLYIIPFIGDVIYVLDIYSLDYKTINVKKDMKLLNGIERNGCIYFYGFTSTVLKIIPSSLDVEYIDICLDRKNVMGDSDTWFWTDSFIIDNNIFLPIQNKNSIIVINIHDEPKCMYMGEGLENWNSKNVNGFDGKLCVVYTKDFQEDIFRHEEYDYNGCLIKSQIIHHDFGVKNPFVSSIILNDRWIALPYNMLKILSVDVTEDALECLYSIEQIPKDDTNGFFSCYVNISKNKYLAIEQQNGKVIIVSVDSLNVEEHDMVLEQESINMIISRMASNRLIMNEKERGVVLKDYLKYIKYL